MKTLFKLLFAFAITTTAFTSCMDKDDTDYEGLQRKEESRVDSLLAAQKDDIEEYISTLPSASEWRQDTVTYYLPLLNKRPRRGMWYRVVSEASEDNTFSYKLNENGNALVPPTAKLKYKASLLDGTVVQVDETAGGGDYSFNALMNTTNNVFNAVWYYSFFPYSIKFNNEDRFVQGLTKDGLRKGSKLQVVAPSYWGFDKRSFDKIPANAILVYEFEVVEIQ